MPDGYTDDDNEPRIVAPVPEHYAGANRPYIGWVDHGVPITQVEPTDEAHYHMGRPVEFTDEPSEDIVPVPVRVVRQGGRDVKRIGTQLFFMTKGDTVQVVGRDEKRTKVTITCVGTADKGADEFVLVGNQNVGPNSGHVVFRTGNVAFDATEPIFVHYPSIGMTGDYPVAASAKSLIVSVLTEYSERVG